jgi:ubiquinone/menaquinone biosynthesis C-methylase UbiE
MLTQFISANRRAARYLRDRMPQSKNDFFHDFERVLGSRLNTGTPLTVLDLGGGAQCLFHGIIRNPNLRLVAIDISAEELAKNSQAHGKVQADLTQRIPLPDSSADIAVSCYVMEHLNNVASCISEVARLLKPGGFFINLFPCKFAPYAIINRALPEKLGKYILHRALPGTEKEHRFPAVYDHCLPRAFDQLLRASGFEIEPESRYCSNGSDYFTFFLPLYLASSAYDFLAMKSGLSALSVCYLSVAKKVN